jgi:hypothetical protein
VIPHVFLPRFGGRSGPSLARLLGCSRVDRPIHGEISAFIGVSGSLDRAVVIRTGARATVVPHLLSRITWLAEGAR